jgi:hypothetical protein
MLTGFNWIRLIRLVAGVAVVYQAFITYNAILGVIGAVLLLQGIFNVGCSGASCMPSYKPSTSTASDEIQYEEITTTKQTNS